MKSAICTLFEGNYHFGVATLINSAAKQGFKGAFYVGYKGKLPEWSQLAIADSSLAWEGAKTLTLDSELKVHFLPVTISHHLTNYKQEFMLELFAGLGKECDNIAYFDPDIVIKSRWDFFETWMSHGVALIHEIVNVDMPPTHPIRREWEKVASLIDRVATRQLYSYINAGFIGVPRRCIEFLELYRDIMNVAKTHYHFNDSNFLFTSDRSNVFFGKDQDVLNIAAMCCECPISEMGPEAMDFMSGGFTMSHAVGSPKPWTKNFALAALKGVPPSMAEKVYWANVNGPISIFTNLKIKMAMISLKFAALVGRFYKRN